MRRSALHPAAPGVPLARSVAVVLVAVGLGLGLAACGEPRGALGAACDDTDACDDALQCLAGRCVARCDTHVACGDGARCDDGRCVEVTSAIGDACAGELACGRDQRCRLDLAAGDADGDGRLAGTCQPSGDGDGDTAALGEPCDADDRCRSGTCALGRCGEMCAAAGECRPGATCADLPRDDVAGAPRYGACLPARGVIVHERAATGGEPLAIPVPSNARSFAVVAVVDDPELAVGATELVDPGGRVLYRQPDTPEQFFANPLRHLPAPGVATLLVPNTPRVRLETGVYRARLAVRFGPGQPSPTPPRVRVIYKVDDGATLDLHVVFLDLDDHPCEAAWGGGPLDAARAPANPAWTAHVAELGAIFAAAGVTLGDVTYRDLDDRADLDAPERGGHGALLSTSTAASGVTLFVVRALAPVGVQVVAGRPQPPRTPGTPESGVVVAADTLCYRPWPAFTRATAHAIAAAMGLYRNREPGGAVGHVDPIDDTGGERDNLMYFGEFGGVELSAGQAAVLRRYPGLR